MSSEIWKNYNSENWNENIFSVKKSYICSLFSELSYEHIPSFELNQKSRIKIIPSENYWRNYLRKQTFSISTILRDMDFAKNFIIESTYLIIIGIKLKETVFITIRGTQSFNDVIVDLKLQKKVYPFGSNVKLHRGFYKAVLKEFDNVIEKLSTYSECNICVTGHSLGGAIAALLFNKLSKNNTLHRNNIKLHSCYTFGMPRYGNHEAIEYLASPFAVYNINDIVPIVPPKFFGYRNSLNEYELSSDNIKQLPNCGRLTFLRVLRLINGRDISEHSINQYSTRLKKIINNNI